MIKSYLKIFIKKTFGVKFLEFLQFINSSPFLVDGRLKDHIFDLNYYVKMNDRSSQNDERNKQLIRKYAHMIDKGLHNENVEAGHSKDVFKKLVNLLNKTNYAQDPSMEWAKDKIEIYKTLQSKGKITPLGEGVIKPQLEFSDIFNLIKSRRTNRVFLPKKVSEKVLIKLLEVVNYSSSSCNKQPIKLYVTNNPETALRCLKNCKGGTNYGHYIPVFISFCADMSAYILPNEMYLPSIDVSLGAQNIFLSAKSLGLSGSILSWAQKDRLEEKNIRKMLKIAKSDQIIFNAVLGYESKTYITPKRKPLKSTINIIK